MSDNNLPKLTETDLTDLWKFHQEHADSEKFHGVRRKAAKDEILRRGAERDATVLPTDAGEITITLPNTYAYNPAIVDGAFYALIVRDGLELEWADKVKHTYYINKTWLNKLAKRGAEYREVIEKMTTAGTGSPSIKGPSLKELGGYVSAEEGAEAGYVPTEEVPSI